MLVVAIASRKRLRTIWFSLALLLFGVVGCQRTTLNPDAGVARVSLRLDSGMAMLSEQQLLRWAEGVVSYTLDGGPGGDTFESRALAEIKWRARSGLSDREIDDIELLVSTLVTQRRIAKLTGAEAVRRFEQSSQALKQKADSGAALDTQHLTFEMQQRAQQSTAFQLLELQFGSEAVEHALRHEARLTNAWETAIENSHVPSGR
jgi:hypothetical protein